jgi:Uri superfamily endonuclease
MSSGTYLLILHLATPLQQLPIGRLGLADFAPGYYLYVGSAFGAGGLAARLAHHRQAHKQAMHWHIDYLRAHTYLQEIWSVACPHRLEHAWGRALLGMDAIRTPVPGFGASDSPLSTHLFYLPVAPPPQFLSRTLMAALPWDAVDENGLVINIERPLCAPAPAR